MAELMIVMRGPDGGSCGFRGETFEADKDGNVTVPLSAAPDLMAHGFSIVGDAPAPKAAKAAPAPEPEPVVEPIEPEATEA